MTRRSRRGFLAGVGAGVAGLAGCSALPWNEESDRTYDRAALGTVASLGHPAVPRRSPAPVEASYLDERRSAVREALDAVPSPIPESDIPNGVVRAEVAESRERAVEALARAESAATPLERLRDLRSAYGSAVESRAGYSAVTDGLTKDAVLADRPAVRADLRVFRDRRRVVGGVDGETIVLQATVEEYLRTADRRLARAADQPHVEGRVLAVAAAADAVADGRTYIADARHLYDRFRATRETRPVGDAFERAGNALLADVRRRRDALPGESFTDDPARFLDVSGDLPRPARELVTAAFRIATWHSRPGEDELGGPASRLLAVFRADLALRTFARVRAAVERGEHDGPMDAGVVRAAKLDALAALERARRDPAHPALANVAATRVVSILRRGDHYLGELSEGFGEPAEVATDAYAAYVRAATLARTIAPASSRVAGAIEAAAGPGPADH